jgi:hypothetical protein
MNFQSLLKNFWFVTKRFKTDVIIGSVWIVVYLILVYKSKPDHLRYGKIPGSRIIQNKGTMTRFNPIANSVDTQAQYYQWLLETIPAFITHKSEKVVINWPQSLKYQSESITGEVPRVKPICMKQIDRRNTLVNSIIGTGIDSNLQTLKLAAFA